MEKFKSTLEQIVGTDKKFVKQAQDRLDSLTKPQGSAGVLEKIVVQLACIQEKAIPTIGDKVIMTMAGDHGVVDEGVSAYPKEVTPQMVLNFLNEGAAINVLAKHVGASVVITDVGVDCDPMEHPNLNTYKVKRGTDNMVKGPAMSLDEVISAVEVGIELVNKEIDRGATIVATGEMGIGNTTASSAILAAFSGETVNKVTGLGTGMDMQGFERKQQVIAKALEVNRPNIDDPIDVLRKVGGLEIAALTGVILGAAARKVPVVLDGFISTAAGLVAYKLQENVKDYMMASHLSQEPGHRIMLDLMELKPVLYLDLRLGEGTGAALAFNVIEAAVKLTRDMATFAEAGVSDKPAE